MASGYPKGRDQHGRVHTAVQLCSDCQKPMRWVTMPSGARNPLEADPDFEDSSANVLVLEKITERGTWALGIVLRDKELLAEAREAGLLTYRSHFADNSCPRNRRRERKDLA